MLQRLLPRFRPRPEHAPRSASRPEGVKLRWLGTAGHVVEAAGTTLLLDPFLTRPSPLTTLGRPLEPTPDAWWRWLPERVDAILVGHSHYDHLMDAPVIARRTGATIVGSASTAAFARAAGVPDDRIAIVPPEGRELAFGDVRVRFVPSLHGRIFAGKVPFPGTVDAPPRLPARLWDYRMGGAFGVHVTAGATRLYHNGSADLVDAELDGVGADVLLVGLAGRRATPDYLARLLRLLSPTLLVPTHHDAFFAPLESGMRLLPGVDFDGFVADAARLAPEARVVTPGYEDVLVVPEDGAAADATLVHL